MKPSKFIHYGPQLEKPLVQQKQAAGAILLVPPTRYALPGSWSGRIDGGQHERRERNRETWIWCFGDWVCQLWRWTSPATYHEPCGPRAQRALLHLHVPLLRLSLASAFFPGANIFYFMSLMTRFLWVFLQFWFQHLNLINMGFLCFSCYWF